MQKEFGSFDRYIWSFTKGRTINHKPHHSLQKITGDDSQSDAMSADLKKRGFNFVGSTICYAYMQASGMVDDHQPLLPRETCLGLRLS